MFKHSKFIFLGLTALLLAGCGGGGGDNTTNKRVRLLVWGPAEEREVYEELATQYKAKLPEGTDFSITFRDVGEGDAATNVLNDVDTAADIFIFADDQLSKLNEAGVLLKLPEATLNTVQFRDSETSIDSATNNKGEVMAFPLSEDNGYYMYYDRDYFAGDEVLNLNTMLETGKLDDKHQFIIDMGNGYYSIAPFAVRGHITYDPEAGTHATDFNNADGLASLRGFMALSDAYKDKGLRFDNFDAALTDLSDKANQTIVAAVTGSWNNTKLTQGTANLAATKLPAFNAINADDTTTEVQMGSFIGSKLMGVKSSTKEPSYAVGFATFLTGEEAQRLRYEKIGRLPTNKVLAASDLTAGNLAAQGLAAQKPFAISQARSVGGTFWDAMKAVGDYIVDADLRVETPQDTLDAFVAAVTKAPAPKA
jgi:arabinogalactan oligomer/maltooligosaccharide transport system substrate-binding protein